MAGQVFGAVGAMAGARVTAGEGRLRGPVRPAISEGPWGGACRGFAERRPLCILERCWPRPLRPPSWSLDWHAQLKVCLLLGVSRHLTRSVSARAALSASVSLPLAEPVFVLPAAAASSLQGGPGSPPAPHADRGAV